MIDYDLLVLRRVYEVRYNKVVFLVEDEHKVLVFRPLDNFVVAIIFIVRDEFSEHDCRALFYFNFIEVASI